MVVFLARRTPTNELKLTSQVSGKRNVNISEIYLATDVGRLFKTGQLWLTLGYRLGRPLETHQLLVTYKLIQITPGTNANS